MDHKSQEFGQPTPSTTIYAYDTLDMKMINISEVTVRSIGWAVLRDTFYVLRNDYYTPSQISISVYDRNGKRVTEYDVSSSLSDPLSIAAKNDSLFILERKDSDTLCLLLFDAGEIIECAVRVPIPSIPNKYYESGGGSLQLEFGSDGIAYISQWMTIYSINLDGSILSVKNGVSSHFTVSDEGLFCIVEDMSDNIESVTSEDEDPDNDFIQPPVKNKVIKFSTSEDGVLDSVADIEYDTINLEVPRFFAANDKGVICCLTDESIFAFSEDERFKTRRLYLAQASAVVDMYLAENNLLYLLYERGRIDIVNLEGHIVINQNGRIIKAP
jgi:hypothetical protein